MLRFNVQRSDTMYMERTCIIFRLCITILLLGTLADLAEHVGTRVALSTTPRQSPMPTLAVQSRRTVMDRIAEGRLLASEDPIRAEAVLTQVVRDARDPELRGRASTLLVQMAEDSWPDDHRRSFLSGIADAAMESGRQYKIPPSIILAQAALESGWGRSRLAKHHHNLFGIKASEHQDSAKFNTLEFGPKGAHIVSARFRTFNTDRESILNHGVLLSTDHRYESTRTVGHNWRSFLAELAPTYASDPAYATHITQLIERYDLDRWDTVSDGIPSPGQA